MADKNGADGETDDLQVDADETSVEPAPTEVLPAPTQLVTDDAPQDGADDDAPQDGEDDGADDAPQDGGPQAEPAVDPPEIEPAEDEPAEEEAAEEDEDEKAMVVNMNFDLDLSAEDLKSPERAQIDAELQDMLGHLPPSTEPPEEEEKEEADGFLVNLNVEERANDELQVDIDAELQGMLGDLPEPSQQPSPAASDVSASSEQRRQQQHDSGKALVEEANKTSEDLRQKIEEFRSHKTQLQHQLLEVKTAAEETRVKLSESNPRTKRQFDKQCGDIEALGQQEKEIAEAVTEKIEKAKHQLQKFEPSRDKATDAILFEKEMKRSADEVSAELRDQAASERQRNSSIRLEVSKLKQQEQQVQQAEQRCTDNRQLAKKQLVSSTNLFHELRTQLKAQEREKSAVAKMAKINIEQQMEKELQNAEWQPKMLLQRRKKKRMALEEQLKAEEMQRRTLKQAQAKGELVCEYSKILVHAIKTMQENVEDTESLNLSHPEAIKHLTRLQSRVKRDLDHQLQQIEARAVELKLPPIECKRHCSDQFERLDSNKDGIVDRDEFMSGRERGAFRPDSADSAYSDLEETFEIPKSTLKDISEQVDHKIQSLLAAEENRYTDELALLQQKRQSQMPARSGSSSSRSGSSKNSAKINPPSGKRQQSTSARRNQRIRPVAAADEAPQFPFKGRAGVAPVKAKQPAALQPQLALADLLAEGEAELAVMREEELLQAMVDRAKEPESTDAQQGDVAVDESLSSRAQRQLSLSEARLKHAEGEPETSEAQRAEAAARRQLQIAQIAEELLGVDEANCLLRTQQRGEVLQQLLDHASCITKRNEKQAAAAIQLLGALPGGLATSSEARQVVHVILQRVAEKGKPLHALATQALTDVSASEAAMPVLLSCFASSRSSRPVAAGSSPAALAVTRAAAAAVQSQLVRLGDHMEGWVGSMMETLVRATIDGLSHKDEETRVICSEIVRVLHRKAPSKLASLAQRCAPKGGMAKVQAAVHPR